MTTTTTRISAMVYTQPNRSGEWGLDIITSKVADQDEILAEQWDFRPADHQLTLLEADLILAEAGHPRLTAWEHEPGDNPEVGSYWSAQLTEG